MGCCSEYIDAYIIIPRYCYPMHSEIVSQIRKYHNHKLQTNPWHWEEEPHIDHETLGRQTKKNNQLSLPHQDDCRSLCVHLWIQQTYTGFTHICAAVHKVIVKLMLHN